MSSDLLHTTVSSSSEEETYQFGKTLPSLLPSQCRIIALYGDLGSGKTTLVKGFIEAVTRIAKEEITSPTFTYVQSYSSNNSPEVHHFDLYRITDEKTFLAMGFDEYFSSKGFCCIEWAERIETLLPPNTLKLTLSSVDKYNRRITVV